MLSPLTALGSSIMSNVLCSKLPFRFENNRMYLGALR